MEGVWDHLSASWASKSALYLGCDEDDRLLDTLFISNVDDFLLLNDFFALFGRFDLRQSGEPVAVLGSSSFRGRVFGYPCSTILT